MEKLFSKKPEKKELSANEVLNFPVLIGPHIPEADLREVRRRLENEHAQPFVLTEQAIILCGSVESAVDEDNNPITKPLVSGEFRYTSGTKELAIGYYLQNPDKEEKKLKESIALTQVRLARYVVKELGLDIKLPLKDLRPQPRPFLRSAK